LPGAPPPWANPARDTARRKGGISTASVQGRDSETAR